MFHGCSNLAKLDLSTSNANIIENLEEMFPGCDKLAVLGRSNFDDNTNFIMTKAKIFFLHRQRGLYNLFK